MGETSLSVRRAKNDLARSPDPLWRPAHFKFAVRAVVSFQVEHFVQSVVQNHT